MSRSLGELLTSVLSEGNFDATEAQALQWLNARHELMCARTKCYRRKIQIGPTVAEQAGYPIPPEVLEIREVQVASPKSSPPNLGVPYGPGVHLDLAQGALHYLWLGGLYLAVGGGIYVRDENSEGQNLLSLYPTPTEAGNAITIFAVCRPDQLTLSGASLVAGGSGTIRYAATTRPLTEAEKATFIAGGGLPAGIGTEAGVSSVTFEYQSAGSAWSTAAVVKDATGAYHSVVSPLVQGALQWRAKGLGPTGAVVWQTPTEEAFVGGTGGLRVPPEFYDALIDGAIATGLTRVESRADLAVPFEEKFAAACEELLVEVNKRYRGSGPATIRVQGFNA